MYWSNPHFNVTHYGPVDSIIKDRWATVTDWKHFSVLTTWVPGLSFNSPQYYFDKDNHLLEAKKAGEAWTDRGTPPDQKKLQRAQY